MISNQAPITIKDPDAPVSLYKFQAITKQTLSNLIAGKLWASSVVAFNDPFEYSHRIVGKGEPQGEIEELYKKREEGSVICLTEKYDDILMWSHYADSHRGFCMHFTMNTLRYKVVYQEDYPELDFEKDQNEQAISIFRMWHTKSKSWEYEQEHRITFVTPPALRDYPGKLKSIFFGIRTSDEDIRTIKGILKDTVRYYKCYISPDKYAFVIAELPENKPA